MKNQEYVLTEDSFFVSKTDLKGIITFANSDLVRITGFSRAELVGSPPNIFRHSDIPKEVFEDLWSTIKSQFTYTNSHFDRFNTVRILHTAQLHA